MAYFKDLMAFPVFFPQEEKAVKKYGDKYGTASKYMAYNVPFVQKGWTGSNLSWKLVKNPDYWDKQSVKLDQISFTVNKTATTAYNLYQSNKIDALGLDSNLTKQFKGKKNYYSLSNGGTYYLELNEKNPNLANSNIRKAISLAINQENLIRILCGNNQVANTYTAKGLTEYDGEDYTSMISSSAKDLYKYQPSKAKEYWQKGLSELGKSSLTLNLLTSDSDSDGGKKTGEALQSMLETQLPGLKLTVTSVPFKTRLARRENCEFQICGSDWIADFADPISFLELLTSKNSSNYGSWKNSQYDKLIAASKNTNNQEKRLKDMSEAESILLDDTGVIPLYYEDDAWLIRSNAKGWICKRSEWNFKEAYVTK
ncbi:oligopeptide abc superfamily atp binding cassette transporter, binding protein [Lactobacillus delbrueckii subsp. lactis DSM 20072]|nr:oligopeptide ABC superfamily ATP binding cassette transporter, binding protein [Lactobacillus delbrueckii subsp. lactis DSM 20072]KRK66559.1 oligopeptide abc superfamily atp binding cassette transporter, binding protein [Lactobacillus delbrueckii subsp. lactis DSM 20072]